MISRFQSLLARPPVQAAASNLGWLAGEKAVRMVLGVVVGFWIARHLGPTQLGVLGYGAALVALVMIFPVLGLDAVVKRDLLERPADAGRILASAFLVRLAVGGLAVAALAGAAMLGWGMDAGERPVVVVLSLLLLQPAVMIPDLWLQSRLQAKAVAAAQLGALALCSVWRIGLIRSDAPVVAFALANVGEAALAAAGIWWLSGRQGLRVSIGLADGAAIRSLLNEAWPLMFAGLAIAIYMRISEVMLRHLAGTEAVGIYTAATRLSEIWYFLPMALASSLLPALVRARQAGAEAYARRLQQYYDLSAGAAYGLSIPMALAAPWIIRVAYGPAYAGAGPILAVHIWASVFVFLGVARGQWLVNERLPGFYLASAAAGAVVNIVLNWILIPRWGGLGAAWAGVAAYAVAGWISSYFHPAVRTAAVQQARALLVPLLGWRYLRIHAGAR